MHAKINVCYFPQLNIYKMVLYVEPTNVHCFYSSSLYLVLTLIIVIILLNIYTHIGIGTHTRLRSDIKSIISILNVYKQ